MRVQITDPSVYNAIHPESLMGYLSVNGWSEVRRIEGELTIFENRDSSGKRQLVWMPVSDEFPDYAPMVARLVDTVAEVENKQQLQLLDDLETVGVGDIIGLRTANPLNEYEHTIPLSEGQELFERVRRMAAAGASSVGVTRPIHPRKPSSNVSQFVNGLRLGQTERGSYIIRLISPIEGLQKPDAAEFPGLGDRQPFSRRAVVQLVRGLNALKDAAKENRKQGKFNFSSFQDGVKSGVSANLCEAVAPRNSRSEQILWPMEISVTWSYLVGSLENLPRMSVRFEPDDMQFIRRAAEEFRARNPEEVTLGGYVQVLSKKHDTEIGEIRLYVRIDGRYRPVRVKLGLTNYERVVNAHRDDQWVEITGTLRIENNMYYHLDDVQNLRITRQASMYDDDES